MRIHFVSAYSKEKQLLSSDWEAQFISICGQHVMANPDEADLIVFTETYAGLDPYFLDVIFHPVYRSYRQKCVLYHIGDVTQTLCRTVSPSIDRFHPNAFARRSFSYLVRVHHNRYLGTISEADILSNARRYLFSFVGDPLTHPIRQQLLALRHPRAFLKAATGSAATQMRDAEREPFQKNYLQTILDSEFILCPRGLGPTSMRLFEVMQLGRVPVIISDEWLPVSGIKWEEFAFFVAEADVAEIPILLEQQQHRAAEMGRKAREVWLEHFSPGRALQGMLGQAAELVKIPLTRYEHIRDLISLCGPSHWRTLVACLRRRMRYGNCAGVPRSEMKKPSIAES